MPTQLSKMNNANYRFVVLGKGEPGSGKSAGLASWARQGPMYIFDTDNRIASMVKMYNSFPETEDIANNIWSDYFSTYDSMFKRLESIHQQTIDGKGVCPYKSLFWDGITSSARFIMNDIITSRYDEADAKDKEGMMTAAGIPTAQIEDYKGENQALSNILSLFRSQVFERAGVNIFVTAHVIEVEQEDYRGKKTKTRSLLTHGKKIAAEIPIYFNEAWHFDVESGWGDAKGPKYIVNTNSTGEIDFAKTALWLPRQMNWTYPTILYDEVMKYVINPELGKKLGAPGPVTKEGW